MSQMELVSPASPAPGQEVMMVTTDDYSYKPGLAAAATPPSFQQHHPPQLQLHGGGDHDKVRLPPASCPLPLPGRLALLFSCHSSKQWSTPPLLS